MFFAELVIPEPTPPQIAVGATDAIIDTLLTLGLEKLWDESLPIFGQKHHPLTEYVRDFDVKISSRYTVDGNTHSFDKPQRAFRICAVTAGIAYLKSGFEQSVDDDIFPIANLEADLEGIPEAYQLSHATDLELCRLVDAISEIPVMQDGFGQMQGGYGHLVALGAGCTRFYLQHAVAA